MAKNKVPGPAGSKGRVASWTGANGYKGIKRYAMDHGQSRKAASAEAVGALAVPGVSYATGVAGQINQYKHNRKEGVLAANRYTNSPATQHAKASGARPVAHLMNRTIGGTHGQKGSAHH